MITLFKDKILIKSFLLNFLALSILCAPLFIHRTPQALVGPYSYPYFMFLMNIMGVVVFVSVVVAVFSSLQKSLKLTFGFLTVIFILVILFFGCEVILRFKNNDAFARYREWGHRKSSFYGFEAKPNHAWRYAGGDYKTDRNGFRVHLQDRNWEYDSRKKIFTLGGSCVFGYGLNDDETWPYQLENYLTNNGMAFDVINAGNNGYNSWQIFLRMYLKVMPFHPDYLIYYGNYNDISFREYGRGAIVTPQKLLFSDTVADYRAKQYANENFYKRTLTYGYLEKMLKSLTKDKEIAQGKNAHENNFTDALEHNGKHYMRNLRLIARTCQMEGVKLILVTFIYDKESINARTAKAMDYFNDLLRKVASEENVYLIDIARDFAKKKEAQRYFSGQDHYHPSKEGAQYIAEYIGKAFVDIERAKEYNKESYRSF